MRNLILTSCVALLAIGCQRGSSDTYDPFNYIPESTDLVIKVNDAELLKSAISNNEILASLISPELISHIDHLNTTDQNRSGLIGIKSDSLMSSVVIPDAVNLNLPQNNSGGLAYKNVFKSSSERATFSMVIKPNIANQYAGQLFEIPDSIFAGLVLVDVYADGDGVRWELVGRKQQHRYEQLPSEPNTTELLTAFVPKNVESYLDFTSNSNTLERFTMDMSEQNAAPLKTFMNSITQWGLMKFDGQMIGLFKSNLTSNTLSQISNGSESVGTFRNQDIFVLDDFAKNAIFKTIAPENSWSVYCVFDNIIAVGESIDALEAIISTSQNDSSLNTKLIQKGINETLGSTADIFAFKQKNTALTFFKEIGQTSNTITREIVSQLTSDTSFYFIDGLLFETSTTSTEKGLTEQFSLKSDERLIGNPQLVFNHKTSTNDIVVQDENNRLKYISPKGTLKWQKTLDGEILGAIEQLDIYKNGRQQMAFTTSQSIYIIDINGIDVAPFPLQLTEPITQPLAVFDYDQKKEYRITVVQGKELFLIDVQSKRVKGFKYRSNNRLIRSKPVHHRIGGKDYIVFKTDEDRIKILNRIGEDRIVVKSKIQFSQAPITVFNNHFTGTTTSGELFQIDLNGSIDKTPLSLNSDHSFTALGKSLITMSENILKINEIKIELPFGNYSPPKVWRNHDNMFVGVTDLQANQIYLYDFKGNLIPDFPAYGSSIFDMRILKKGGFQLVTLGDDNSIIFYQYQ
jgi:hypothetical protein